MKKPQLKAFPNQGHYLESLSHMNGMDLRDYFAAKALQGMLAMYTKGDDLEVIKFSKAAYLMADEMMRAREFK